MGGADQDDSHRMTAVAGFVLPAGLLLLTMLAFTKDYLAAAGWRGGEYAYAFLGVALGAVVAGAMCKLAPPRSSWRSFGSGLLVAGTLGFLAAVAAVAFFVIGWSLRVDGLGTPRP